MTSCGVAAAVPQRKATAAIVNVVRLITPRSYHFLIAMWSAKDRESRSREVLGNHRIQDH
jgi:hypothetical protein